MSQNIPAHQLIIQLEKLSTRLSEIVKRDFYPMPKEQLVWKTDSNVWSIAECIEHLNLVAFQQHPKINPALLKAQKSSKKQPLSFKYHWWTYQQLNKIKLTDDNKRAVLLECPLKYQPKLSTEDAIEKKIIYSFLEYQDNLLQFIAETKVIEAVTAKISIRFWGLISISLVDFLSLLIYHNERHIIQAQKIHYHDLFPH